MQKAKLDNRQRQDIMFLSGDTQVWVQAELLWSGEAPLYLDTQLHCLISGKTLLQVHPFSRPLIILAGAVHLID